MLKSFTENISTWYSLLIIIRRYIFMRRMVFNCLCTNLITLWLMILLNWLLLIVKSLITCFNVLNVLSSILLVRRGDCNKEILLRHYQKNQCHFHESIYVISKEENRQLRYNKYHTAYAKKYCICVDFETLNVKNNMIEKTLG